MVSTKYIKIEKDKKKFTEYLIRTLKNRLVKEELKWIPDHQFLFS